MIKQIYQRLFDHYGPQHWWPAQERFEILVGAILTQNTNWQNVERALHSLSLASCTTPEQIVSCPDQDLAAHIRSSGYFNVKARRLKAFCSWLLEQGGLAVLDTRDTGDLRAELLSVHGIGPETADDMLLYAFERPVFVIDAYTRRIFSRVGLVEEKINYEDLQCFFEDSLDADVGMFNEYHALIVRHGKEVCRTSPRCDTCVLKDLCAFRAGVEGPDRP